MLGVAVATIRLGLMLWAAVADSKEDDEFDWTTTIVGCVIYTNFGGMYICWRSDPCLGNLGEGKPTFQP